MAARSNGAWGSSRPRRSIVGSMIGSGIFIAPSIMAGLVATPGIYLGALARRWRADLIGRAGLRRTVRDDPRSRRPVCLSARGVRSARRLLVRLDGAARHPDRLQRGRLHRLREVLGRRRAARRRGGHRLRHRRLHRVARAARRARRHRRAHLDQLSRRRSRRFRAEPVHGAQGRRHCAARHHWLHERQRLVHALPAARRHDVGPMAPSADLPRRRRRGHVQGALRLRRVEHGHLRRRGDPRAAAQPAARARRSAAWSRRSSTPAPAPSTCTFSRSR